jgi:subtilisin family serine protease
MTVDIGLIDSGVNAGHSHVGWVAGGVAFQLEPNGEVREYADFHDSIGHGTAIAGIIRERVPQARIYALRIFHESLEAQMSLVTSALEWAIDRNMKIIHLSLGIESNKGGKRLLNLCGTASERNLVVVAAARSPNDIVYPSSLDSVIGVYWNRTCDPEGLVYHADTRIEFGAYGLARELPGVAPQFNFRGSSFAAAHVTARVAQFLEKKPKASVNWVRKKLIETATESTGAAS